MPLSISKRLPIDAHSQGGVYYLQGEVVSVREERREGMGNPFRGLTKALKDFLFGAAYLEFEQAARQEKLTRLDLILLFSFGDALGVPVFPPYHSLRLLPYLFPAFDSWKKRMLKERDLTEIKSL